MSSTPESAARAVAQSTNVSAVFSEAVTGLNISTFILRQGTTSVPAGVTYDSATRTATLDPSEQLAVDTSYTATLTRIKDAAGNVLADRVWTFTTGPRPTVTTVSPAAGATGVAPGTNTAPTPVTAAFSESVTGLSSTTFTLQRGSTSIAGTVTYNATTRVATFTPSSALLGRRPTPPPSPEVSPTLPGTRSPSRHGVSRRQTWRPFRPWSQPIPPQHLPESRSEPRQRALRSRPLSVNRSPG
nr:Ig-like domain-containing protein [Cryobacterium sp. Y29]